MSLPISTRHVFEGLRSAIKERHVLGLVDHSFQLTQSATNITNYATTVIQKMGAYSYLISTNIYNNISSVLNGLSFLQFVGSINLIGSGISLFSEIIALYQQNKTLQSIGYFPSHLNEEEKTRILETSRALLKQIPFTQLRQTLPDYLQKELQFDTVNILDENGSSHVDQKLQQLQFEDLVNMRVAAKKKEILHGIGVLGAVIGVVCAIGMLVAWPALVITLLSVCCIAIGIGLHVFKKAWLENPHPGIDFKRAIPLVNGPPAILSLFLKTLSPQISVTEMKEARKIDPAIALTLHQWF
ncbi:hypothetical protein [Rhabdochlamydiaceae symbiont of Dictyostelium giganteum]|uniref:hypothetical protein n=1 Tax=Rhabdochlamydiaceae symbiont of Dictyostelium giganteum TaxID=3342349 RepID=UPI00384C2109